MRSSSSRRASRPGAPSSSWTTRRSRSASPASPTSRARWVARSTRRSSLGLTNVLFGRKKLKKANEQRLFAITTARITLETDLGLKPTGNAAVIFKPLVYWIYGFKRGAFWPFIPTGESKERDNAEELELKAKLEKELPVEQDLTRWLALFDAPI